MGIVFPTYVGVFLPGVRQAESPGGLPHVRGGVSRINVALTVILRSSPRTWGCFFICLSRLFKLYVFPTYVGVFPGWLPRASGTASLPHVRGGVSLNGALKMSSKKSSPRTWGCFRCLSRRDGYRGVFPTYVGVFPPCISSGSHVASLPHVRGGVSQAVANGLVAPGSSPRTWGCFVHPDERRQADWVFPTYVGVFLGVRLHHDRHRRLPHVRGGVSAGRASENGRR